MLNDNDVSSKRKPPNIILNYFLTGFAHRRKNCVPSAPGLPFYYFIIIIILAPPKASEF